jgi:hypothetical protein
MRSQPRARQACAHRVAAHRARRNALLGLRQSRRTSGPVIPLPTNLIDVHGPTFENARPVTRGHKDALPSLQLREVPVEAR